MQKFACALAIFALVTASQPTQTTPQTDKRANCLKRIKGYLDQHEELTVGESDVKKREQTIVLLVE